MLDGLPTTLDSSNDIAETANNSLKDCEVCHIPVYDVHGVERDLQEFDEWIFRDTHDHDRNKVGHGYRASAIS